MIILKIVNELFKLTNEIISSLGHRGDKDSAIEKARELRREFDKAFKGLKIIDQNADVQNEIERVKLEETFRQIIYSIIDNADASMHPDEIGEWKSVMKSLTALSEIYHFRGHQVWAH